MSADAFARQRCFHHPSRAAVARCLSCLRTYCRECVTEHDDRVLCAACLAPKTEKEAAPPRGLATFLRAVSAAGGVLLAWILFYAIGRVLLLLPNAFHAGSIWR